MRWRLVRWEKSMVAPLQPQMPEPAEQHARSNGDPAAGNASAGKQRGRSFPWKPVIIVGSIFMAGTLLRWLIIAIRMLRES